MKLTSHNLRYYKQNNINKLNNNLTVKQSLAEMKQDKYNTNRPAQELHFGGSALSMLSSAKGVGSKVVDFVFDNEVAYNAIYALIFAGILKPLCVLNMHGSEDKDKQIVATKNFLQAFIGSFINYTIGGTLINKSMNLVNNNIALIKPNKDGTDLEVLNYAQSKQKVDKLAIKALTKEKSGIKHKYRALKKANNVSGFSPKLLFESMFKKAVVSKEAPKTLKQNEIFIPLKEKEIQDRAINIIEIAKKHSALYRRNGSKNFANNLIHNGNVDALTKTAERISSLTQSKDFEKELDTFVDLVTKSAQAGKKSIDIKELTDEYGLGAIEGISQGVKSIKIDCKTAIQKLSDSLKSNLLKVNDPAKVKELLVKFVQDSKKYFADESLQDTYGTFWKNSTGWATSILKARIASKLLPVVMVTLFAKRNLEKEQERQLKKEKAPTLTTTKNYASSAKIFEKAFNLAPKEDKDMAFKGSLIETTAYGIQKIATSTPGQGAVNKLHNLKKPLNKTSARAADIESFIITAYWTISTWISKKIAPDQKLGLILHSCLVTAVSSVSAFLIDTILDPLVLKGEKKYRKNLEQIAKNATSSNNSKQVIEEGCKNLISSKKATESLKQILGSPASKDFFTPDGRLLKDTTLFKEIDSLSAEYTKKMRKLKSLTVFTTIVRFLVPVLMVPVSGKLKKKVKELQSKTQKK